MILSLVGFFNIIGSLLSGYLSAKMSKKIILSAIYLLRGVSIILFISLPASNISAFIFGATFGFLWLSTVPATVGIVAHIFGTKYLGLLYGLVFLSHQIGSFFGAYLGGLFHDLYGSYDYAWYLAIALSVFAGIIHLPIKEQAIERLKPYKIKFSPYLEKLYNSDKPLIIYKVNDGYNLYTDFSKKIILTNKNINNFFKLFSKKKKQ